MRSALAAWLGAAAACRPAAEDPWGPAALARLSPRARAAQLLVVPADTAALRHVRLPGVGGVQLAGGDAVRLRARLALLQRSAPRPLLVVADLEQGLGGAVRGATVLPPPSSLIAERDARDAGKLAAREARALGVNLARVRAAPLAPGPGAGPPAEEVYAAALAEGGVAPVPLAFGPHQPDGRAVEADRAALEAGPLRGLRRLAPHAGGVELAWVALPALTGDSVPLPLSPVADAGLLRRDLGLDGVRVADLGEGGEWRRRFAARAPLAAVAAGADLLLGVDDPSAAVDTLANAVREGRLSPARLDEAAGRVFALKRRLGLRPPVPADTAAARAAPLPAPEGRAVAERLHAAALRAAGDPAARLRACRAPVVAARRPARVAVLAAELGRLRPGLRVLMADSVPLRGDGGWRGAGADCALVIEVDGEAPAVVAGRDSVPADSAVPRRGVIRVVLGARRGGGSEPWASAGGTGELAQRGLARLLAGAAPAAAEGWPPAPTLTRSDAAPAGMRPDSLAAIDRTIRAAIDSGVFTGAAVAVGRRGRLVKLAGYGRTAGRPVDPDSTLFDLASLTKVVGTTAAVMTLVDDDEMEVGAPLRRYLPRYRGGGRGDVTVRHLLAHTAGLPPGDDLYSLSRSPEAALRRVQRAELRDDPGERYVYSDFGMILAAAAVEAQAEEPLDHLLARRVFGPLGMASTRFRPAVLLQDRIVPTALRSERPYVLDGVVHDGNAFRLGGVAGHAGLFSTVRDVAVFAQTILNGGAYGEERVWSTGTVRAFVAPQRAPGGRGLGWDVPAARSSAGDYISSRAVGHTGYTGTSLWIDPGRELFVVLLTNRTYDRGTQAQIYAVRRRVHDLAVRAISDQTIRPRPGTAAARAAERPRPRRPAPRRPPRRPRRG